MGCQPLSFCEGQCEDKCAELKVAEQASAARGLALPNALYSLNLTLATWSSLLVEMSGVKSTRGPTRV
jgi:hypothetical protein